MAAPQTKRHATLVSDFAAASQGASATPLDFTEGSVFLAMGEAIAGVGTWLQKLFVFALSVTRLVSSKGIWVDTFVEAYGMARQAAVPASGLCVFSRYNATAPATIPVGAVVGTGDNSQNFTVYADPTNGAYSAAANGYVILPGANAVTVPVVAVVAGIGGNVAASTISRIKAAMQGVDAVTNTAAFTTGRAAESDAAVKVRFPLYLASLFRATRGALADAVASLGQGLQTSFLEFQRPDGTADANFNTVYVDDGSGAPSAALVSSAAQAVNDYRAFGVRVGVFAAHRLPASVLMSINVAPGYVAQSVVAAVDAALTVFINGLGLGQTLFYTRLIDIAYGVPGVANVVSVSLNGAASDLVASGGQTIKAKDISTTATA